MHQGVQGQRVQGSSAQDKTRTPRDGDEGAPVQCHTWQPRVHSTHHPEAERLVLSGGRLVPCPLNEVPDGPAARVARRGGADVGDQRVDLGLHLQWMCVTMK